MGEWTGVVNIENRIGRNRGRVLGILPFLVPFKGPKDSFKWHVEFLKNRKKDNLLIGRNNSYADILIDIAVIL